MTTSVAPALFSGMPTILLLVTRRKEWWRIEDREARDSGGTGFRHGQRKGSSLAAGEMAFSSPALGPGSTPGSLTETGVHCQAAVSLHVKTTAGLPGLHNWLTQMYTMYPVLSTPAPDCTGPFAMQHQHRPAPNPV